MSEDKYAGAKVTRLGEEPFALTPEEQEVIRRARLRQDWKRGVLALLLRQAGSAMSPVAKALDSAALGPALQLTENPDGSVLAVVDYRQGGGLPVRVTIEIGARDLDRFRKGYARSINPLTGIELGD